MAELNSTSLLSDANLRSYYRLANATDEKGNNNGSASNITFTTGKYGNGASFNGTSSKITLGSGGGTWGSDTQGSIAAWVYLDSVRANNVSAQILAFDQTATGSFGGRLYFKLVSNGSAYALAFEQGNAANSNSYSARTGFTIGTGSWVHVAVTWDGSTGKFYIGGVDTAIASGSFAGSGWFNAANNGSMAARMGASNYRGGGEGEWFPGDIDDLAVLSDALTSGEVGTLVSASVTYTQSLSVTATAVPTLTKGIITLKNLSATALAVVNLSKIRTVVKSLAATATAVPTLVKSWIHLITLSVGSTTPTLRASYSETNEDGYISFNTGSSIIGVGQSFETSIISVDAPLDSVKFYMKKTGSPTGMGYAKLYAHSGTFGTNSVPTGSPLATSDPFDVSTLGTSPALVPFTFSGSNRVLITESTRYVVTFETTAGAPSNTPMLAFDSTPGHAGNYSEKVSGWTGYSTGDLCFYLYTATLQASAVVSITKNVSKSLSVTALAVATLTKFRTVVRALSATATAVVSLSRIQTYLRTLSATATASVNLTPVKIVVKTLSVTATAAVDLATQVIAGIVTISLSVTATASVTLTKTTTFFRTLAVEAVSVVSLTKGLLSSVILQVTATAVPTLSRVATHVVGLSVTAVARVKLYLDGLLSSFSRKFPRKPGSYSEKFPSNPGSYSEKYPSKPGTYEDKYPS